MIHSLAKNIALFFSQNGIIQNEDKDIYEYGLELVLSSAINIVGIFVMMFISKLYIETLLYFIGFSFLRVTAGGYHAKTHFRCLLMSLGFYQLSMLLIFIHIPFWVFIVFVLIMLVTVTALSPVEDENKPLDNNERNILKRKSIILAFLIAIISIVLYRFNAKYAACIALGFLSVVFSLLLAVTIRQISSIYHKTIDF